MARTPTFFVNGVRFDGDWTNPDALAAALTAAIRVEAAGGPGQPSA